MSENALMMIHKAWTIVLGNEQDMTEAAGILRKLDGSLITTYASRTGLSRERLDKMMSEETWLTATQARSLGFATSVVPASGIAARVPANRFNNVPKWVQTAESATPSLDAIREWVRQQRVAEIVQRNAELRKT